MEKDKDRQSGVDRVECHDPGCRDLRWGGDRRRRGGDQRYYEVRDICGKPGPLPASYIKPIVCYSTHGSSRSFSRWLRPCFSFCRTGSDGCCCSRPAVSFTCFL